MTEIPLADSRDSGGNVAYSRPQHEGRRTGGAVIKRFVVAVSFISVVLSLLAQTPALGDVARPVFAARAPAPSAVRVGASFVIESPMADYVHELDPREQREQTRDWAVLGTLARFGATPQQLA